MDSPGRQLVCYRTGSPFGLRQIARFDDSVKLAVILELHHRESRAKAEAREGVEGECGDGVVDSRPLPRAAV